MPHEPCKCAARGPFFDTSAGAPARDILSNKGDETMLWTIFVILIILWALGLVGFYTIGAYVHLLLLAAVVILCIRLIGGGRVV
jgi:hypothetical protein